MIQKDRHSMTMEGCGKMMNEDSQVEEDWWGNWHQWKDWSEWSAKSWKTPEFDLPENWDTSSDIFIPEFLAGFLYFFIGVDLIPMRKQTSWRQSEVSSAQSLLAGP